MSADSPGLALRTLVSIERSFQRINGKLLEALARIDQATTRISALGEIHLRLAKTIVDILGIPEESVSHLTNLTGPIGAISSAQRAELMASGSLRPIIRCLRKQCREIAQAINAARENILKLTSDFDSTEMEIIAKELCRDPDRVLSSDEQEALRNKIREWTVHLKDAFSGS